MMDFLITPSGDLAFSEVTKETQRLEISFYNSKTKAVRINFDIDTYSYDMPKKDTLVINFDIRKIKNNKRAMMVSDDAYLMQQILMRLKTNLGELPERLEIGSKIETVMHKNLQEKSTQKQVEQIVSNAIKDLLYNYSVKAVPIIQKDNDYRQIMNVMIYENNELIFTYEMEG